MTHQYYAFVANEVCDNFAITLPTKYVGCAVVDLQSRKTRFHKARGVNDEINVIPMVALNALYYRLCEVVDKVEKDFGTRYYIFRDLRAVDLSSIGLKLSFGNSFTFGGELEERGMTFAAAVDRHLSMQAAFAEMVYQMEELKNVVAIGQHTIEHRKFIAQLSIHQSVFDDGERIASYYKDYFEKYFRSPLKKLK